MSSTRPVLFVSTGTIFVPTSDRGFYRRYRVRLKRCIEPSDRIVTESLIEERDDGTVMGGAWSFRRIGGSLEGGLYRRYRSVVEQLPCPFCRSSVGQLCRGSRGYMWGGVHWVRSGPPSSPRRVLYRPLWKAAWANAYPEMGLHLDSDTFSIS